MDKVTENRLRRLAQRRELVLVKSRRRDVGCPWFGKWMLKEDGGDRVIGLVRNRGWTLLPCGEGGPERHAAWMDLQQIEKVLVGLAV